MLCQKTSFLFYWTVTYVQKLQYQVIEITADIGNEVDFLLKVFIEKMTKNINDFKETGL